MVMVILMLLLFLIMAGVLIVVFSVCSKESIVAKVLFDRVCDIYDSENIETVLMIRLCLFVSKQVLNIIIIRLAVKHFSELFVLKVSAKL